MEVRAMRCSALNLPNSFRSNSRRWSFSFCNLDLLLFAGFEVLHFDDSIVNLSIDDYGQRAAPFVSGLKLFSHLSGLHRVLDSIHPTVP